MRNRRGHHNPQGQCLENQVRCCCGKLLAKQIDNGVVLKCTRCKREIIIRFSEADQSYGSDDRGDPVVMLPDE